MAGPVYRLAGHGYTAVAHRGGDRRLGFFPRVAEGSDTRGIGRSLGYVETNEGKLIAVVASDTADAALAALRAHPRGSDAAVIGTVVDDKPGRVTLRTTLGGRRIVDMPLGEQLPRIC